MLCPNPNNLGPSVFSDYVPGSSVQTAQAALSVVSMIMPTAKNSRLALRERKTLSRDSFTLVYLQIPTTKSKCAGCLNAMLISQPLDHSEWMAFFRRFGCFLSFTVPWQFWGHIVCWLKDNCYWTVEHLGMIPGDIYSKVTILWKEDTVGYYPYKLHDSRVCTAR